jgi:aspartate 1-decarboxylase
MLGTMLQAKLHGVRVAEASFDYEGSCGIDEAPLQLSGLRANQYIEIYNVANSERFSTYIIKVPHGSGMTSLNGAAARKAVVNDKLIIAAYSQYTEAKPTTHAPLVVLVDEQNRPRIEELGAEMRGQTIGTPHASSLLMPETQCASDGLHDQRLQSRTSERIEATTF